MSTIPATAPSIDVEAAHVEALGLRAKLKQLHLLRHELTGDLPPEYDDLVGCGLVGVARFGSYPTWWTTTRGLRLFDVEVDPGRADAEPAVPVYAVTWRADGVLRATNAIFNLATAREGVSALIAALRDGERVSRVTVLDEAGVNVTADVARGLVPPAEELASLARRADFLAGLTELHAFLKANPGVPVPLWPQLTVNTRFAPGVIDTDDARRDALYVAAAALGVDAESVDDGGHVSAERKFGSITYRVICISAAAQERYGRVQVEGERVVAEQDAAIARPTSPAAFHPAGPVGWTADADGGTRS